MEIDDAAALWAARAERVLSHEEAVELERWLAGDVRRTGAYARARAVAANSRRLSALKVVPEDLGKSAAASGRHAPGLTTRRAAVAAVAALSVGGAGLGAAVWRFSQSYRTGLGEVREFALEDGSRMSLSALSAVSVRFDRSVREVVMAAGEALFEVAEDPRPFRILTAGVTVAADRARVLLRRYDQQPLQVTALRGSAAVEAPQAPSLRLEASQHLAMTAVPTIVPLDAAAARRALAWRDGRLALHDVTLGHAARDFSRFSARRISFGDEQASNRRITGLFDARDPLAFARAAALSLGLALFTGPEEIRLSSI